MDDVPYHGTPDTHANKLSSITWEPRKTETNHLKLSATLALESFVCLRSQQAPLPLLIAFLGKPQAHNPGQGIAQPHSPAGVLTTPSRRLTSPLMDGLGKLLNEFQDVTSVGAKILTTWGLVVSVFQALISLEEPRKQSTVTKWHARPLLGNYLAMRGIRLDMRVLPPKQQITSGECIDRRWPLASNPGPPSSEKPVYTSSSDGTGKWSTAYMVPEDLHAD